MRPSTTNRRVTFAVLSAVLVVALASAAPTQDEYQVPPAPRFMSQFGITEEMFDSFCTALQLDASQRAAANSLHAKYLADAEQYSKELYERVLDAGLREYWKIYAEARDSGRPTPTERMNELHQQYSRVRYEGYPHADDQVAGFYAAIADLLTDAQERDMDAAERLMRRLNWYQRVAEERTSLTSVRSDFDLQFVNPFMLWTETTKDWPERAALWRAPCVSSLDVADPTALAEEDALLLGLRKLRESLENYELQIDTVVRDRMEALRRPPSQNRPGVTSVDSPKYARWITRWSEEHRIVDRCMTELIEAARLLKDDAAATSLRDRYFAALCPDLVRERWPDLMVDWLSQRADATPEQVEAARDLYAKYQIELRQQIELAVEAGVSAKRKNLFASGDEPEQQQYVQRLDGMRQMIERTLITFRSLLRPEQVGDFDDQAFADLFMHHGELGGPGGGGFERLREILKPPTSVDELDRRAKERWKKLEKEKRDKEMK